MYVNSLIKLQEKDGWMKKQKVKIIKAIFCIYDPVSKIDVRVEVSIPGGTNVYSVDQDNVKAPLTDIQWNVVFISSILRSFNPCAANCLRIENELQTREEFKDFLLVSGSLHKAGHSNIFVEYDPKANSVNAFLLSEIAKYLRRNRRINELIRFLNPLIEEEPALVCFI